MALIAPSIASISGSVSAPDAPTLRTQIERVLALQGGLGRQLVDVQVTGGGAGAIWFADMTFAPNDESEASVAVDPATVLVRVVEAIEPLALNVGIFRALTDLDGAGALWIPKVCIAAGGAGAVCLAVVLGSTSARPLPGGGGGPQVVEAMANIPHGPIAIAAVPTALAMTPIAFSAWTAGDVLDLDLFVPVGAVAPNLLDALFFPQVSTDGGGTWQLLGNGTEGIACGAAFDLTTQDRTLSVATGCACVPAFTGQPPRIRVAYTSVAVAFIGAPAANAPAAVLRARRIPAAQFDGVPPYSLQ